MGKCVTEVILSSSSQGRIHILLQKGLCLVRQSLPLAFHLLGRFALQQNDKKMVTNSPGREGFLHLNTGNLGFQTLSLTRKKKSVLAWHPGHMWGLLDAGTTERPGGCRPARLGLEQEQSLWNKPSTHHAVSKLLQIILGKMTKVVTST